MKDTARWVYAIPAYAPDLACCVYVGHSKHPEQRLNGHRKEHAAGTHRNIPADYSIDWSDVQVTGPFYGTAEEVTKGAEQEAWESYRRFFQVLNKLEPRHTTNDPFIAASSRGGRWAVESGTLRA